MTPPSDPAPKSRRKTRNQRIAERVRLLHHIKTGQKHTKANAVLAPLAQADLIQYEAPPPTYRAQNVRLTAGGESYLDFYAKDLGLTLETPDEGTHD